MCSCWLNAYQFLHIAKMTSRFLKITTALLTRDFCLCVQISQRTSCLSVCVRAGWFFDFCCLAFFLCFFLFIQFYESKVRRECVWRSLLVSLTFRSVHSSIIYFVFVWLFITGFFCCRWQTFFLLYLRSTAWVSA